ncbi:MAG: hypothetical protein M2R45_00006 [Verrucomicrobia subdivision 3 bacterium]|nr:hypothetical protein [Limisphaerales bacterium]MCS1412534.1 hypothetical protein [Limisphaerales bacterium]
MTDELECLVDWIATQGTATRVLIVTGSGKGFCVPGMM